MTPCPFCPSLLLGSFCAAYHTPCSRPELAFPLLFSRDSRVCIQEQSKVLVLCYGTSHERGEREGEAECLQQMQEEKGGGQKPLWHQGLELASNEDNIFFNKKKLG